MFTLEEYHRKREHITFSLKKHVTVKCVTEIYVCSKVICYTVPIFLAMAIFLAMFLAILYPHFWQYFWLYCTHLYFWLYCLSILYLCYYCIHISCNISGYTVPIFLVYISGYTVPIFLVYISGYTVPIYLSPIFGQH